MRKGLIIGGLFMALLLLSGCSGSGKWYVAIDDINFNDINFEDLNIDLNLYWSKVNPPLGELITANMPGGTLTATSSGGTIEITGTDATDALNFDVNTPGLNHNDLGGLQGGQAGQYYHLTASQHGNLHPAHSDDQNLFLTVNADSGSLTADNNEDDLNIVGGIDINTVIAGGVLTVNYTGTGGSGDLNDTNAQTACLDGNFLDGSGACVPNTFISEYIDTNLYNLGVLSDGNVFWVDLNTVGDINGFRLCINGDCILSWDDVNTYEATLDGNLYSLEVLSDGNVFQIDLNTIGDVNAFRLCINGDCIGAWADVNTYPVAVLDGNLYGYGWADVLTDFWLKDIYPENDPAYSGGGYLGVSVGNDENRFRNVYAKQHATGLLAQADYSFQPFTVDRSNWNYAWNSPATYQNFREYKSTGYSVYQTEPGLINNIRDLNAARTGSLTFVNAERFEWTRINEDREADVNQEGHYLDYYGHSNVDEDLTAAQTRYAVHDTGISYNTYNGVVQITPVPPGAGCDIISVTFDENLPISFSYSVTLTGYSALAEFGFPEPQLGTMHTDGVITGKTASGFTGEGHYTIYDAFGRMIFNPTTGQPGEWCNITTLMMDMVFVSSVIRPIDYQLEVYQGIHTIRPSQTYVPLYTPVGR